MGIVLGLIMTRFSAYASDKTSDIGFNVAATLPTNQINKNDSFFNLAIKSGSTQKIEAKIYNLTNRDIQVETGIHTAFTNSNGNIEYNQTLKNADASLKLRMNEITKVDGPTKITIPAASFKKVSATIKIPKTDFNGVIQGGWFFKKINNKVTGTVKNSMNFTNEYSYVIGLKYVLGKIPEPKLVLSRVQPGLKNHHQNVFPEIRNTAAVMIPQMTFKNTVTDNASHKVIQQIKKNHAEMAPNSAYEYPIFGKQTTLRAGNYHLHVLVTSLKSKWIFDRDFTISKAVAEHYNRASVDSKSKSAQWFMILGAGLTFIAIALLILVYWIIRKLRARKV